MILVASLVEAVSLSRLASFFLCLFAAAMPPKSGRRRAAAARAKPAAASLDCEQQHEQHSLADDGAKESAAAALARECPALRRLIDSHLARIDAEGTFGGSVAAPERVLQSQTVQKDGEKGGDESETVSWRRRRARIALSRRFGRPRPSLSHSNSKNKTKTPTVDRRMHTILIPLGEHQDEQLYHAMKAQVARIPEQVCFLLSSLSSSTFFLFAPEKKLMFLSVSLSLPLPPPFTRTISLFTNLSQAHIHNQKKKSERKVASFTFPTSQSRFDI